jgi:hypothetical protein
MLDSTLGSERLMPIMGFVEGRPSSFSPRKRHEAVPVWHFYFLQRLRVHRIAIRDDAVEVQNIGNHCIDLVVGQ